MIDCRLCKNPFDIKNRAENYLMHSCLHGVAVCKKCDGKADKINKRRRLGIKHDPRWSGGKR